MILSAPTDTQELSVIDRARLYLQAVPPAISGNDGHGQTFSVACALVNGFALCTSDAEALLKEYSATCQPPWTDKDVSHKIRSAALSAHTKPRGHLLGNNAPAYTPGLAVSIPAAPSAIPSTKQPGKKYDPNQRKELPDPINDPVRRLLLAVFQPGDCIAMADAVLNADGRSVPKGSGTTDSREGWLASLDDHDGDPNGIFTEQKAGAFMRINPIKPGGKSDADVTHYRHALIEFDSLTLSEQYGIIKQSNVPCSAILHSGGKSIHAWVKVDAKDREDYDSKVAWLYDHFLQSGIDIKNKNPSRFSRLVGVNRGDGQQNLLELNCGAESFAAWRTEKESEGLGELVRMSDIINYDPTNDPNTVLGQRWLCRGGSCIWVGQSGIGKSSLAVQAALSWALNLDFFGIKPPVAKPLKSLIIQAENDLGDMAEMFQGVNAAISERLANSTEEQMRWHVKLANENIICVRNQVHTGFEFVQTLRKLIEMHQPDIVWVDPLLAFFGDDISNQKACSQFLRNWINPILEATGVVLMLLHHTNKPSADSKSKSGWTRNDYSYAGTGSSELTNWARAVVVLRQHDDNTFRLALTKRGKRATALNLDGQSTQDIYLVQAEKGISWTQVDEPEKEAGGRPKTDLDFDILRPELEGKNLKWWEIAEIAKGVFTLSRSSIDKRAQEIKRYLTYDKKFATYSIT